MDYRSVIEEKIMRSERICDQLNNINNIFLGIVAIAFIMVFLFFRQFSGIVSFLLIPVGIFTFGLTYLFYLIVGAFISLLEQTTIQNILLIESDDSRAAQHEQIMKGIEVEIETATSENLVRRNKLMPLKEVESKSKSITLMIIDDEEVSYTYLVNNLAKLKHASIRTKAKVLQKIDSYHYQVATNEDGTDDLMVLNDFNGYEINVNDWIDVNGTVKTHHTYTTSVGSRLTVPVIELNDS